MAQRRGKKKKKSQEELTRRRWLGLAGRGGGVLGFIGLIYWIANGEKTVNARVIIEALGTDGEGLTTVRGRFDTGPERGAAVLAVRFPFKFKEPPEVRLESQTGTLPPPEIAAVKPSHFRVRSENPGRGMIFFAKGRKLL